MLSSGFCYVLDYKASLMDSIPIRLLSNFRVGSNFGFSLVHCVFDRVVIGS